MTRVLVVHHDLGLGGQEADSLRRFGYDVIECGGPTRNRCPVLAGHPCDLAERADVLVYDVWASGDAEGARTLIENIRDIHPETPVVLTSPGLSLSWEESSGHARGHHAHWPADRGAPARGPSRTHWRTLPGGRSDDLVGAQLGPRRRRI
jgi:hypothetical protein